LSGTCTGNSTGTCRVVIDGSEYLGIETGLENSIIKTVDRDVFLREPGKLWDNGRISDWKIETVHIDGDRIVPAGKWLEGKTLADTTPGFSDILNLARFYRELKTLNRLPDSIYPSGIYFSGGSSILLFPDTIMDLVVSHRNDDFLLRFEDPYKHPDLSGESAVCFFLGICAYKTATGELPYKGGSLTELRELIRKSRPVPPEFKAYGLKKDVSDLIMRSLNPSSSGKISLDDWAAVLEKADKEGFFTETTETDKAALRKKADKLERKRMRMFRIRQFLSKNGIKFISAAAAVTAAAIIFYTPVKKALEPPVTAGLSPEEVVRLYYDSYNRMDVESMQDCVTRSAGKKDINEISGIFVISKVRKGYEGDSGIINADKWIAEGKKELTGGENIFGLTDIRIKKISGDSFTAEYTKWITRYEGDRDSGNMKAVPAGIHVTDILHLSKRRRAWIIDSIKRSESSD